MNFIPVILCGGSGSRLYPLSRTNFPKQFVKINNKYSLLQNTIIRFNCCKEIILVSGIASKYILIEQLKELIDYKIISQDTKIIIFLESFARNTLPAISLVCKNITYAKLLFIPCDHIYCTETLIKSVSEAINSNNPIVTFGIKPSYPETGFGYINVDNSDMFVNKFIEKPNLEKAKLLIIEPNNYWNSGIFLLEPNNFNNLVKNLRSSIWEIIYNLNNIQKIEDNFTIITLDDKYSECENISIDYGIMELLDSKQIFMIKYDDIWNDIGSFKSIHDILEKDESNINKDIEHLNLNSSNCLIKSDKLVLLNNVSNLSIIDSDDVLLVSELDKSQEVKKLYELAIQLDKNEIRYNNIDYRPWGKFEVLAGNDNSGFKVKKITVFPNKRLSLQSHNFRKEYWFNLTGKGIAQINDEFIDLENNSMVHIDFKVKHRLINNSEKNLEIIELQLGTYLGEDDIIRYEDDFQRN
jgi:mannose-1-phosphate guanylyltransferase/mannose-6-phosphate isomerase